MSIWSTGNDQPGRSCIDRQVYFFNILIMNMFAKFVLSHYHEEPQQKALVWASSYVGVPFWE